MSNIEALRNAAWLAKTLLNAGQMLVRKLRLMRPDVKTLPNEVWVNVKRSGI